MLNSCCACRDSDIAEDIQPESVQPLGNYAVQITWQDGFNQVRLGLLPAACYRPFVWLSFCFLTVTAKRPYGGRL